MRERPTTRQFTKRCGTFATVLFSFCHLCHGTEATNTSGGRLLRALQAKGILTEAEVHELEGKQREQSSLFAPWVTGVKFTGDFRARYEGQFGENPAFPDRNRFRTRGRVGTVIALREFGEVGLRLATAEPAGDFGGDQLSENATYQNNASKKFIWLDRAYARWQPLTGDVAVATTVGKMENPLKADLLFDADYAPEGIAQQLAWRLDPKHRLELNAGAFVLDDFFETDSKPYLFGGKLQWEGKWSKRWESLFGLAGTVISGESMLTNNAVPNVNRGNTRIGPDGRLAEDFAPIEVDATLTYKVPSVPFYPGEFPIRLLGGYINNVAADDRAEGFVAGLAFGRSGKKRTWEASYVYRYAEGDSQYEEFVDSDFGAFYESTTGLNTGGSPGVGTGTNIRGHIFRISYSPYDALTLAINYMILELIDPNPAGSPSEVARLQVDAVLKF